MAVVVLDAMTREMQKEKVFTAAALEEGFDLAAGTKLRLVDRHIDVEIPDLWISKDPCKDLGVSRWGSQTS
jgi:hypothetical protein